jgi:hypothetical protein
MRNQFSFLLALAVVAMFVLKADKCETTVNQPDTSKEQPSKDGS